MTSILAVKPGHDGCAAWIRDGRLEFSIEGEKDNWLRHTSLSVEATLRALSLCNEVPNVLAHSGWSRGAHPAGSAAVGAGYQGIEPATVESRYLLGKPVCYFASTHERSHIMCAYGMSPFPAGQPCYALVWEGHFGNFYVIDEKINIKRLATILVDPGIRYAFLYGLADPTFAAPLSSTPGASRISDAGKLMALAAFGDAKNVDEPGRRLVAELLRSDRTATSFKKDDFRDSGYHSVGVEHPPFLHVARALSDGLFDVFERGVRPWITQKLPLLISGGCGLNCDWNSRWRDSGLFSDVFIPPCPNDSGSAIGTAIDAMWATTGNAKLEWSPYAGEKPIDDQPRIENFVCTELNLERVAELIAGGAVIAWMRGRYEIGPRALGARSLLASAGSRAMLERLNRIKGRERFRPIAPVCLEEDAERHFSPGPPSPYMLEFRRVVDSKIPAVTHVDGSARPQTVNASQNKVLHNLLLAYRRKTQVGVLCNTSLNFNGYGFMNRLSDVYRYSCEKGIEGFVFEDRFYQREQAPKRDV
jgi:predicted NodU family carbamoyl transferase